MLFVFLLPLNKDYHFLLYTVTDQTDFPAREIFACPSPGLGRVFRRRLLRVCDVPAYDLRASNGKRTEVARHSNRSRLSVVITALESKKVQFIYHSSGIIYVPSYPSLSCHP